MTSNILLPETSPAKKVSLDDPRVAVVVPIYKHSALVAEAVKSILSQEATFRILTVLVNDGCPFQETHEICRDFALSHVEKVVYLKKENGGLSSARNAGISYVLEHRAYVDAIYFLDADNCLSATTIASGMEELENNPDTDWIYPNIDTFGLVESWDFSGDYSLIRNLHANLCEAGSLVRRRIFEAGLRFDEAMQSGYEDWDFWLSAAEKGFRGRCLDKLGLQYRRRPESMLKGSSREDQEIRSYMRKKHKGLFAPKTLMLEEQRTHPRYAIYLSDLDEFLFATDPACESTRISFDEFERMVWRNKVEPNHGHVPDIVVATDSVNLKILLANKLLHWALWHLEDRLDAHVSGLWLEPFPLGTRVIIEDGYDEAGLPDGARPIMAVMTRGQLDACLMDASTAWFDTLFTPERQPKLATTLLALPQGEHSANNCSNRGADALRDLQRIVARLHRSDHRRSVRWAWRQISEPHRTPIYTSIRKLLEIDAPLLPRVPSNGGRDVAFALPYVSFGGVEKVATNVAEQLSLRGFTPHLVITDARKSDISDRVQRAFDTISFLCEDAISGWDPQELYLGTAISRWSGQGFERQVQHALGLMCGFDVVINAHSQDLNAVMGDLRRLGVKTVAHLHVVDLSAEGRPTGHPFLAVAYEHAYDAMLCCSASMRDWLAGMGVPRDKLVFVPNAPSFTSTAAECEASLAERAGRSAHESLRILVLGRLDRQKGIARVEAVYERLRDARIPVEWRIVGAQVVSDTPGSTLLPYELCYPPMHHPEGLAELYQWADVLLLLSDWEGLPLTILEAMPFGCVPITTEVGAVKEAVQHATNGFLLNLGHAVEEACQTLALLQADRPRLLQLARAASLSGRQRNWTVAVQPLVDQLNTWFYR